MFWISTEGHSSLGIFGNQPDLSRGQFGGLKNRVGNPTLEFGRHVEEVPDKVIPASGVPASLPKDWLDGCRGLDSQPRGRTWPGKARMRQSARNALEEAAMEEATMEEMVSRHALLYCCFLFFVGLYRCNQAQSIPRAS